MDFDGPDKVSQRNLIASKAPKNRWYMTLGAEEVKCGEAFLRAGGRSVITVERKDPIHKEAHVQSRKLSRRYGATVIPLKCVLEEALEACRRVDIGTYNLDMMSNWCQRTEGVIKKVVDSISKKTLLSFVLIPRENIINASLETQKLSKFSQEYFRTHRLEIITERVGQICSENRVRIKEGSIARYYKGREVNRRNGSKARMTMMFFLFELIPN